jgi:putative transposase
MRPSSRRVKQLAMKFPTWGGKRKGAGRPRLAKRAGTPHQRRQRITGREPLHVTLRVERDAANLRTRSTFAAIKAAFEKGCDRFSFRVVQFSVQRGHLHLIVEAKNWDSLSRGVKGLSVRLARKINAQMKRTGRVFDDRYHARVLTKPLEVRNALVYVLQNAKKHFRQQGIKVARTWIDPFSSAAWFEGWATQHALSTDPRPVADAETWLLEKGWKRHGHIRREELPAAS